VVKQARELKMSLDRTSAQNGEKVYLTIKVLAKDKNFVGEFFAIAFELVFPLRDTSRLRGRTRVRSCFRAKKELPREGAPWRTPPRR
jgi:hypothetical protein